MTPRSKVSPPSVSLPPLKSLELQSQERILDLIASLVKLYCPLTIPLSSAFASPFTRHQKQSEALAVPLADSGYVSETNEGEDDSDPHHKDLDAIRMDAFERSCALRWVTGFVTRAEGCATFTNEDARQSAIEDAYMLIEALSLVSKPEEDQEHGATQGFRRDFRFDTAPGAAISVFLHDKLAGTNSSDPDDVGLQSWGASILFSRLLCRDPERFGFGTHRTPTAPCIVEFGAGTGLVSLALGALLPRIGLGAAKLIATDYHPAVLDNLRANVDANMADHDSVPIASCALDWSAPTWDAPLHDPADVIIATDVIYSPLHAEWVRDCASDLLASGGTFWLMTAVRQNGRFEGVSKTVKAAFASSATRRQHPNGQLQILECERLEKPPGIGRGDESWYELFKIGWQ